MKIGALAKGAGVSVQTVRYYERRKLLPEPERKETGYRDYGVDDLQRLRFVRRAKELGFTLAEVAELLDLRLGPGHTADDVRERARVKIAMTKAKVRDLRRIQAALERLVNACDAHGPPEECALMRAIGADANF